MTCVVGTWADATRTRVTCSVHGLLASFPSGIGTPELAERAERSHLAQPEAAPPRVADEDVKRQQLSQLGVTNLVELVLEMGADLAEAMDNPRLHCPVGCEGGACETCPCCAAGYCVYGLDGIPGQGALADLEQDEITTWWQIAAKSNPVILATVNRAFTAPVYQAAASAALEQPDPEPELERCASTFEGLLRCTRDAGHAAPHANGHSRWHGGDE